MREQSGGSSRMKRLWKTNSEWPQSGPVIPLSSNEVIAYCVNMQYVVTGVEPRVISSPVSGSSDTGDFLF
ncbi:MAG: hypothetical protein UDD43_07695 [Agathobacter sp.]|nr:hypothetical protein [Agathobacter sp.]